MYNSSRSGFEGSINPRYVMGDEMASRAVVVHRMSPWDECDDILARLDRMILSWEPLTFS